MRWVHVRAVLPGGLQGFWRRWSDGAVVIFTDELMPAEQADELAIDLLTDEHRSAEADSHGE